MTPSSLRVALVYVQLLVTSVLGGTELLSNPDLEQDQFQKGAGGWYCNGCTATQSSDAYSGSHSVHVSHRRAGWAGIYYNVTLQPNTNYFFKARVKILNTHPGSLYAKVAAWNIVYTHQGHKTKLVGEVRFMEPNEWQVVGGDFTTPSDVVSIELSVRVTDSDVNYLLDSATLQEVPDLPPDWRTRANSTIDSIRKADISISVAGPAHSLQHLTVEVNQLKHEFGFGSAVSSLHIDDDQHKAYQDFFYDNFEWGVVENWLKWGIVERVQGHPNYDRAMNAIDAMLKRGIKMRAHNVFWDVEKNVPGWQHGVTGQKLYQQMETRIQQVVTRTRGKVEQWDVNNENIHGHFYELGTGDRNATAWMFQQIHKVDPGVKLLLNDFSVVNRPSSTQSYYDQAMRLKATPKVPLYGLGIQSHLKLPIDMSLLKYRLDEIVATGLPLWITELDIGEPDVQHKAALLEDVMTLYFSTPQIGGIMLWGFWDGKMANTNGALATGPKVTPNAAGLKWQQLVKRDWRTLQEERDLASGQATVRGFKGEYLLKFKNKGVTIHEETVVLGAGGANVTATISGLESNLHVSNVLVG